MAAPPTLRVITTRDGTATIQFTGTDARTLFESTPLASTVACFRAKQAGMLAGIPVTIQRPPAA